MPVYGYAASVGVVKIQKRGKWYCVYRLKRVIVNYWTKKKRFEFEKRPFETWSYKPYEDNDIANSPEELFEYVKRYASHKIHIEV